METQKIAMEIEDYGAVEIELYPEIAPITVENFLKLVDDGFYNGLTFHRVIEGFMIQGGCPLGTGSGDPGWSIKGEFAKNGVKNPLKHKKGVVSMARADDYDSAGSQFFICLEDTPHLDGLYAAFGKVTKGMDIIEKIGEVDVDIRDCPHDPIVIESVELL